MHRAGMGDPIQAQTVPEPCRTFSIWVVYG
jgi:hypothetical protein